jgi:pimeloyl-ACP methyl ester carboxylesterase
MDRHDVRANPLATPGAPPPRIHRVRVNGTTLYAEERGAGRAVLLIPGGAEDTDGWAPIADRLGGCRVITYDRRGTSRSGRDDWPGRGSAQHADDAAAMLVALDASDAVVVGGSSAGVIAVELALRHPRIVRRVLAYEPGYLRSVAAGAAAQAQVLAKVDSYLGAHPGDWQGAYGVFAEAVSPPADGARVQDRSSIVLAPAPEWYADREERNAEPLVRDDLPILTAEAVDEAAIAACPVDIRFAHGSETSALFRAIVVRLAALRDEDPEVLPGVGHSLYLQPDAAADWVARHASP